MENQAKPSLTVRQYLEKSGIPEPEWGWLLDMCSLISEITPDKVQGKSDIETLIPAVVNNRHLLAMIRHQAAELDALRRISLHLTASLELPEVLASVVTEALRLVKDAHDVHIFLYQDDKLTFGATLDADGNNNNNTPDPRPYDLAYTVARLKEMIIVEDVQNHPLYSGIHLEWSGAIIGLPLMVGQRVVGVMNLARRTIGEFSDAEVRLLRLLADQAAIAVINARLHEAVSKQAYTDILTGLPNRRALDERIDEEVKRAGRAGHPLSVVMMDLDGFKNINDTFGHVVGDQVLRQAFGILVESVRSDDFLARYGGDELTLILPDTPLEQARVVASKMQRRLRSTSISLPDGTQATLNLSGGIAVMPGHARTAADLLRAADEALYRAKKHQRGTFLAAKPGTGQLPTL